MTDDHHPVAGGPGSGEYTPPSMPEPHSSSPWVPVTPVAESIRMLGARGDKLDTKRQRGAGMAPIAPRRPASQRKKPQLPPSTLLSEGGSTISWECQDHEGEVQCPQDPTMAREADPQQLLPLPALRSSSLKTGEMLPRARTRSPVRHEGLLVRG